MDIQHQFHESDTTTQDVIASDKKNRDHVALSGDSRDDYWASHSSDSQDGFQHLPLMGPAVQALAAGGDQLPRCLHQIHSGLCVWLHTTVSV